MGVAMGAGSVWRKSSEEVGRKGVDSERDAAALEDAVVRAGGVVELEEMHRDAGRKECRVEEEEAVELLERAARASARDAVGAIMSSEVL